MFTCKRRNPNPKACERGKTIPWKSYSTEGKRILSKRCDEWMEYLPVGNSMIILWEIFNVRRDCNEPIWYGNWVISFELTSYGREEIKTCEERIGGITNSIKRSNWPISSGKERSLLLLRMRISRFGNLHNDAGINASWFRLE